MKRYDHQGDGSSSPSSLSSSSEDDHHNTNEDSACIVLSSSKLSSRPQAKKRAAAAELLLYVGSRAAAYSENEDDDNDEPIKRPKKKKTKNSAEMSDSGFASASDYGGQSSCCETSEDEGGGGATKKRKRNRKYQNKQERLQNCNTDLDIARYVFDKARTSKHNATYKVRRFQKMIDEKKLPKDDVEDLQSKIKALNAGLHKRHHHITLLQKLHDHLKKYSDDTIQDFLTSQDDDTANGVLEAFSVYFPSAEALKQWRGGERPTKDDTEDEDEAPAKKRKSAASSAAVSATAAPPQQQPKKAAAAALPPPPKKAAAPPPPPPQPKKAAEAPQQPPKKAAAAPPPPHKKEAAALEREEQKEGLKACFQHFAEENEGLMMPGRCLMGKHPVVRYSKREDFHGHDTRMRCCCCGETCNWSANDDDDLFPSVICSQCPPGKTIYCRGCYKTFGQYCCVAARLPSHKEQRDLLLSIVQSKKEKSGDREQIRKLIKKKAKGEQEAEGVELLRFFDYSFLNRKYLKSIRRDIEIKKAEIEKLEQTYADQKKLSRAWEYFDQKYMERIIESDKAFEERLLHPSRESSMASSEEESAASSSEAAAAPPSERRSEKEEEEDSSSSSSDDDDDSSHHDGTQKSRAASASASASAAASASERRSKNGEQRDSTSKNDNSKKPPPLQCTQKSATMMKKGAAHHGSTEVMRFTEADYNSEAEEQQKIIRLRREREAARQAKEDRQQRELAERMSKMIEADKQSSPKRAEPEKNKASIVKKATNATTVADAKGCLERPPPSTPQQTADDDGDDEDETWS